MGTIFSFKKKKDNLSAKILSKMQTRVYTKNMMKNTSMLLFIAGFLTKSLFMAEEAVKFPAATYEPTVWAKGKEEIVYLTLKADGDGFVSVTADLVKFEKVTKDSNEVDLKDVANEQFDKLKVVDKSHKSATVKSVEIKQVITAEKTVEVEPKTDGFSAKVSFKLPAKKIENWSELTEIKDGDQKKKFVELKPKAAGSGDGSTDEEEGWGTLTWVAIIGGGVAAVAVVGGIVFYVMKSKE